MKAAAFGLLACASCCETSEYVPVSVPVYAPASAYITQEGHDPCEEPAPDIATCTPVAFVRVRDVTTQPHCFLDAKVAGGETGRVMQCPSSTIIVFGGATFVGHSSSGYLHVCKSTRYDFAEGDACTWRTEQRISGSLSQSLAFSYTEGPVAGQSCTLACTAHAILDVIPTAP